MISEKQKHSGLFNGTICELVGPDLLVVVVLIVVVVDVVVVIIVQVVKNGDEEKEEENTEGKAPPVVGTAAADVAPTSPTGRRNEVEMMVVVSGRSLMVAHSCSLFL